MDDWEKFNETSLLDKKDFYSHLNMEDISDTDYVHAKRVCKDFEIKNLGEYHDFYVQANVAENLKYVKYVKLEICVLKYMSLILKILFQLLD